MTRRLKVKTIYKALEKNGLPWGRGLYRDWVGNYCALGQAAHNLKVEPTMLHQALNRLDITDAPGSMIALYNDNTAQSYEDVVKRAKEILEPYFDKTLTIRDY